MGHENSTTCELASNVQLHVYQENGTSVQLTVTSQ